MNVKKSDEKEIDEAQEFYNKLPEYLEKTLSKIISSTDQKSRKEH